MNRKVICEDGVCRLIDDDENEKKENDTTKEFPFPNKEDEWTVYGASWCGYCRKAKELLEKKEVIFSYYDINKIEGYNKNSIKKELESYIGYYNTIPIVFNKDKFIGGYNEMKKILR